MEETITYEKKLKAKDYAGYTLIDAANNLTFSVVGSFLTVFYTDILGIAPTIVFAILMAARVWDAVNDPIMGNIAQRMKPTKDGKFKPWILRAGIPLAISAVLMFTYIPGIEKNQAAAISWAIITYVLYGMIYTVLLVPYGSLATVMTRNEGERSFLSVCRSVGGGVGGLVGGVVLPMFVYKKVLDADGNVLKVGVNVVKTLNANALLISMAVIAVVMVIFYIISNKLVKENYEYPPVTQKVKMSRTFKELIKNRTFVIASLLGCLLIASSMYIATVNTYIFKDYYVNTNFITYATVATYIPMAVLIPFVNKLINKFGKKSCLIVGLAVSTVASLIMWVWKIPNPWVYLAFCFLQGAGVGFLTLEVWALAMDAIDDNELKTHRREEAASYAVFTFMRKMGQALAALAPLMIGVVGYNTSLAGNGTQTAEVVKGMYNVATLVPFIMFAVMLVLAVIYPLSKKKTDEMRVQLAKQRAEDDAIIASSDQAEVAYAE